MIVLDDVRTEIERGAQREFIAAAADVTVDGRCPGRVPTNSLPPLASEIPQRRR
jgi:hypothetical protein